MMHLILTNGKFYISNSLNERDIYLQEFQSQIHVKFIQK